MPRRGGAAILFLYASDSRESSSLTTSRQGNANPRTAAASSLTRLGVTLGFAGKTPLYIVLPCFVAPVLYLGPLYADYLSESLPFQRRWSFHDSVLPLVSTWVGRRNYIVVRGFLDSPMAFLLTSQLGSSNGRGSLPCVHAVRLSHGRSVAQEDDLSLSALVWCR